MNKHNQERISRLFDRAKKSQQSEYIGKSVNHIVFIDRVTINGNVIFLDNFSKNNQEENMAEEKQKDTCPKCGKEISPADTECGSCGIIFSKYLARQKQLNEQIQKEKQEDKSLLSSCPVCKKDVSVNASTCPHCGEPLKDPAHKNPHPKAEKQKKKEPGCLAIFVVCFSILLILGYLKDDDEMSKLSPREQLVQKQFSAWDGSHPGLTKYIKDNMNDPSSYEHVETKFLDKNDYIYVISTFRGKNAFGALVKNSITAKVDYNGNVMEIIESFH